MADRISALHRVWLGMSLILLGALGVAFLAAPDALMDQLGMDGSPRAVGVFRVASSVLIAEAVIVALALRSGSWSQTRYVTYLLAIHFTVETFIRLVVFALGESGSLIAAIPQGVIALGLLFEVYRRREPGVQAATT